MRRIRISAALALAALAALAAFASASASARTVLCKENESQCSKANILPSGTVVGQVVETNRHEGNSFQIKSSSGFTFECSYALLGAKTTAESGSPLPAAGEGYLNPSLCNLRAFAGEHNACTQAEMTTPPATIVATGGGNGTLTLGTAEQHMSFSFTCVTGATEYTCKYGASSVPLKVEPKTYAITAKEVALTRESSANAVCGATAKFNASGELYEDLFISEVNETVLCESDETLCAQGNVAPSGSYIPGVVNTDGYSGDPETSFTLADPTLSGMSCGFVALGAKTTAESGNPLPGQTENYVNSTTCLFGSGQRVCAEVTITTPPASVTSSTGGGTVTFGSSSNHFSITLSKCAFGVICKFGTAGVTAQLSNSTQRLSAKEVPLTLESSSKLLCGATASLSFTADLDFNTYVSKI